MNPVSPELLVVAILASLFAAFIHGSIGFGFAMVATPLLALVTDIQAAIVLTLVPTLVVNLISIASEGNILFAFRRFLPLGILAMSGSAVGTQLLIIGNPDIFKLILALAIILYLFAGRLSLNLSWIQAYPKSSLGVFGITAGVLGGLTNVMAPVLIIYSMESRHSRGELIQASNVCFFLGKLSQLVVFILNDKFTLEQFFTSSLMIAALLVSLLIGVKLRKKLNIIFFSRLMRGLLVALAVMLICQVMF